MSDAIASGTDVPAASTVTPITAGWTPSRQPSLVAHVTIRKERTPADDDGPRRDDGAAAARWLSLIHI